MMICVDHQREKEKQVEAIKKGLDKEYKLEYEYTPQGSPVPKKSSAVGQSEARTAKYEYTPQWIPVLKKFKCDECGGFFDEESMFRHPCGGRSSVENPIDFGGDTERPLEI